MLDKLNVNECLQFFSIIFSLGKLLELLHMQVTE